MTAHGGPETRETCTMPGCDQPFLHEGPCTSDVVTIETIHAEGCAPVTLTTRKAASTPTEGEPETEPSLEAWIRSCSGKRGLPNDAWGDGYKAAIRDAMKVLDHSPDSATPGPRAEGGNKQFIEVGQVIWDGSMTHILGCDPDLEGYFLLVALTGPASAGAPPAFLADMWDDALVFVRNEVENVLDSEEGKITTDIHIEHLCSECPNCEWCRVNGGEPNNEDVGQ